MELDVRVRFKNLFTHPSYGLRLYTRHSMILMMGGLAYVALGVSMLGWTPDGPRGRAIAVALRFISIDVWSWVWIITGAVVLCAAWWPARNDKWGYTVLTGLASAWAAIYLAGLLFEANSFNEIAGALVWTLVACLWWGIAGLVNPEDIVISIDPLEEENGDGT